MSFASSHQHDQEITGTQRTIGQQQQPDMIRVAEGQYAIVHRSELVDDSITFELRNGGGTAARTSVTVAQVDVTGPNDAFDAPKVVRPAGDDVVVGWRDDTPVRERMMGPMIDAGGGFPKRWAVVLQDDATDFDLAPAGRRVRDAGPQGEHPRFRGVDAGGVRAFVPGPAEVEPGPVLLAHEDAAEARDLEIDALADGGFERAAAGDEVALGDPVPIAFDLEDEKQPSIVATGDGTLVTSLRDGGDGGGGDGGGGEDDLLRVGLQARVDLSDDVLENIEPTCVADFGNPLIDFGTTLTIVEKRLDQAVLDLRLGSARRGG